MARARINQISTDVVTDSGSVLWSIVRGEQLELPIELTFIEDVISVASNLTFEAVIIEGQNTGDGSYPITVEPAGDQITLNVRIPSFVGVWNSGGAYTTEEIVSYSGSYYKRIAGIAVVDPTSPDISTDWEETTLNTIYVQIPNTVSISPAWSVLPTVGYPVYGFFELRITENSNPVYVRSWKPVRGMLEILFSPTHQVPDQ